MVRSVLAYAILPGKWDGETVGRFAFLHPGTSLDLVHEVLARAA